jgi:hypothetical protein
VPRPTTNRADHPKYMHESILSMAATSTQRLVRKGLYRFVGLCVLAELFTLLRVNNATK